MTISIGLINDTLLERHHGCDRVSRTIRELSRKNGMVVDVAVPVGADFRDPRWLDALRKTSLVLVNGEGTIHHDRPAGKRLVEVGPYFSRLGIPTALINSTWHENGPELVEAVRAFDIVTVRESASYEELLGQGVFARRIGDLALFHPVSLANRDSTILFTDSVRAEQSLQLEELRHRFSGTTSAILYDRKGLSGAIFWLRAVELRRQTRPILAVRAALRQARAQVSDAQTFERSLASARLIVSGRFHTAVIALVAETPLLTLESNTPKLSATLRDVGLEAFRMTEASQIDDQVVARGAQWQEGELARLRSYLHEQRALQEQLFADLRDLCS